jgi:hypothetical protein
MAVQRCAQVLDGVVVNVILADPATFSPGDGSQIIVSSTAEVGWTVSGGVFVANATTTSFQTTGLTFLQFMALFSSAEQAAIVTSTDAQVKLFLLMATGAGALDLGNPEVVSGVDYLASLNLIAAARVATILSGAPPS